MMNKLKTFIENILGKNKMQRITILVFLGLFVIGFIPKFARFITTSLDARTQEYVALTETPTISDGLPDLDLSGELKPYLKTEIFSRVNGLVNQRYVQLGDKVRKGQLLATIDTPDLDQEASSAASIVISAKEHLRETQYQYTYAKQSYNRYKKSAVGGAISTQEIDSRYNDFKTSEMNYFAAKADVNKAAADLSRIRALQGYKRVVAPFSGVISKYNVDAGANVVAGGSTTSTSLFEIQQIDKFRVSLNIPQNYVQYIKMNASVDLYTPDNPKTKFKGTISQISNCLDTISRTMEVVAVIKNDGHSSLYPGLYVKSAINIKGNEKIMTINPACLTTLTDGEYVVNVDNNSIANFMPVKRGRDFGDKVEILEGLKGDENLITNITDGIKNGQKVKWKKNN